MQEEISVLIIEDEPLWAKSIQSNLDDFGFRVVGLASNFEEAVTALNRKDYDVVLMDIHLHGKETGIELGKMVSTLYHKPFIFITASYDAQLAQEAVAVKPSAYLTKPVHPASLFATIQSAIQNFHGQNTAVSPAEAALNDSFFVKQGEKYKKIFWKDIVSLHSEKNYTGVLNAKDNHTYFIRSTLPKTLRFLVPQHLQSGFIQINRSEVIQLAFIQELTREEIKTSLRSYVVTEGYMKELKERLRILQ
ncbi:MAG TPA: response regulator transcription factor [Flavisolibacter sp.]|jgi:DNA-binding LytR/AlgR family response regulator|nr:response regulator transcription factor [Flavisolibacter sp.]